MFDYNQKRRRKFVRKSHVMLREEIIPWIKTSLETGEFEDPPDTEPIPQGIVDDAECIRATIRNCLLFDYTFRQEHFHCHIARYNPSMPHLYSARYRPPSHVPPARSSPLRFVKIRQVRYNLPRTHRTCVLMGFRKRAAIQNPRYRVPITTVQQMV